MIVYDISQAFECYIYGDDDVAHQHVFKLQGRTPQDVQNELNALAARQILNLRIYCPAGVMLGIELAKAVSFICTRKTGTHQIEEARK